MNSLLGRSLLLALGLGACRYEVRLDDEDAASMADVPSMSDGGAEVGEDVGRDAPPEVDAMMTRPCEGEGVDLAPVRTTSFDDAASFAASGEGLDRRFAVLVPPAARADGATTSRLMVLDRRGTTVAERELALDAAGGALYAAGSLGETAFFVLASAAIHPLDATGAASGPPIALPSAPRRPWAAGWLDDAHLAWVSSEAGEPLAVLDAASGVVTTSSLNTAGMAGVLVHRGGVTVVSEAPANDVIEYASSLTGEVTFRAPWPAGPLAHRLWGVETTTGIRRWVVTDGGEFRNTVELYEVPSAGAPVLVTGQTIFAPLFTELEGDLLSVGASDGQLWIFDFVLGAFRTLTPPTGSMLGRVEREDAGYAELYVRLGTTLTFRCGVP